MHKNWLWICFLGFIGLASFGYFSKTVLDLYRYYRLNVSVVPETMTWTVGKANEELFFPEGTYRFSYQGKVYVGSDFLTREKYRNEEALQNDLPKFDRQKWSIWFRADQPNISTLQKIFPWKECIYTLFLFAIFLYLWRVGKKGPK